MINKVEQNPIIFVMSILLIPAIIPILVYLYIKPIEMQDIITCSAGCMVLYIMLLVMEMMVYYIITENKKEDKEKS